MRPLVPLTYPLCAVAAFLLGSAGIAWLAPELSGHYITHGCNAVPPRALPRGGAAPFLYDRRHTRSARYPASW